jgi:type IV secretory pathway TrbF-like protein
MTENNNKKIERANDLYFDIYQKSVVDLRKWQLVSLGLGLFALLLIVSVIILSKINKPIPYIITVNKLGKAKVIKYSAHAYPVSRAAKEYFIGRWVHWMFNIDRFTLKKNLLKAYTYLTPSGQEYFKEYVRGSSNPFAWSEKHRGNKHFRILSVNFIDPYTVSVHTKETVRARTGSVIYSKYVDFIIHIVIVPPTSSLLILKNPLGIYIKSFTINKAVGGQSR